MFTGLIEATGRIERVRTGAAGAAMRVATPLGAELAAGASVAVSGVCLTVVTADADGFAVDVSPQTMRVSTLGSARAGQLVNLERPLKADARLGGHFVLGHVDATGRIKALTRDGGFHWLEVDVPDSLTRLLIDKGSLAIDGISLTIAALSSSGARIQIVPFTFDHTSLSEARPGDAVNLEADVIGKYVARLLERMETPTR
jgi:riboflavin synthase